MFCMIPFLYVFAKKVCVLVSILDWLVVIIV